VFSGSSCRLQYPLKRWLRSEQEPCSASELPYQDTQADASPHSSSHHSLSLQSKSRTFHKNIQYHVPPLFHFGKTSIKGISSAESSRSVRGLGKGIIGKPYPRLCNARRPRLEPGTTKKDTKVRGKKVVVTLNCMTSIRIPDLVSQASAPSS